MIRWNMRRRAFGRALGVRAAVLAWGLILGSGTLFSQPVVADHESVDLSDVPEAWISKAASLFKIHYTHTSHGGQLLTGLKRLSDPDCLAFDPRLKVRIRERALSGGDGLCVMDGQLADTYITPELYWKSGGDGLTRQTLEGNRSLNLSMWAWCAQLDDYSEREVREYLETVSALEESFPRVRFVYFTGNAQATGAAGANRFLRNEQIREFCRIRNKVLYDFEDLDSWHDGVQATYIHDGRTIPVEHPYYHGDEDSHTTYESCENKGRALWGMLAALARSDALWAEANCDCDGDGFVNGADLLLRKIQVLAELTDRISASGSDPGRARILDRVDFAARRRALLAELRAWAVRCGFVENPQ